MGAVVIAGGGTAGHVVPAIALGKTLRDRGHEVRFVGAGGGVEARLVPAAGFAFHAVAATPLPRRMSVEALRAPWVALDAARRVRPIVRDASAVVGMGGYVSVSTVLAARRERVPVVLHEQNAIPGLANRALARLARVVALSFADAGTRFGRGVRVRLTGNPVREEILRVLEERDTLAKEAREALDLDEGRTTVLIFGGSQGALHIDRAAVGACRLLRGRSDLQVVLITGPAHLADTQRALRTDGDLLVRTLGFMDRMELAYACANLAVSRSGASAVAELTVSGLPALLIPYPYATHGHQEANARALQRAGGASVFLDDQLSAESLAERIATLVAHRDRLAAMAERSKAFGRPDAARRLADVVEEAAAS